LNRKLSIKYNSAAVAAAAATTTTNGLHQRQSRKSILICLLLHIQCGITGIELSYYYIAKRELLRV